MGGTRATDAELLAAAAAGDHGAFRQLYERVFIDIERYVASKVAHEHVEDVMAETFLRIYRSAGGFEDRGRPAIAWMVTIARNVIYSHHRSAARRGTQPVAADERTRASIEELTFERFQREDVLLALAELPLRQRQVLTLRFLDNLPVEACARHLTMSEDGVRSLTYRSLKVLRRILGGFEGEEDG